MLARIILYEMQNKEEFNLESVQGAFYTASSNNQNEFGRQRAGGKL